MPIANTVEATIVVNFEDRFTGPSQKAFEQFRKYAESTFRAVSATGIAAFEQIRAAQEAALKFDSGPGKPDVSFWREMLGVLGSVASVLGFVGLTLRPLLQVLSRLPLVLPAIFAGFLALTPVLAPVAIVFAKIALAASLLYLAWKGLQALGEIAVNGKPIREYLQEAFAFITSGELIVRLKQGLDEFLGSIGELARGLADQFFTTLQSLPARIGEITDRMFQAGRDLFDSFSAGLFEKFDSLKSRFFDFVGGLAARARSLFVDAERSFSFFGGGPSGAGNPGLDDALLTLERTAPLSSPFSNPLLNLEPQFEVPSFSSGIRFVPRDMLARIHKGETVLPRSQAEQFRRGGSGGDNITFNITGGLVPDQATARKFARMLEGERRRINERRSL